MRQNKIPLNPGIWKKSDDAKYSAGKSWSSFLLCSIFTYCNELMACLSVLFHCWWWWSKRIGIFSQHTRHGYQTCCAFGSLQRCQLAKKPVPVFTTPFFLTLYWLCNQMEIWFTSVSGPFYVQTFLSRNFSKKSKNFWKIFFLKHYPF